MGQIPFWAGVEFDALKTAFKTPAGQRAAAIMAAAKALDHVVTVGKLEIPKGGDPLVREFLAAQRQTLNEMVGVNNSLGRVENLLGQMLAIMEAHPAAVAAVGPIRPVSSQWKRQRGSDSQFFSAKEENTGALGTSGGRMF